MKCYNKYMKYFTGYIVGAVSGVAFAVDPEIASKFIGQCLLVVGVFYFFWSGYQADREEKKNSKS